MKKQSERLNDFSKATLFLSAEPGLEPGRSNRKFRALPSQGGGFSTVYPAEPSREGGGPASNTICFIYFSQDLVCKKKGVGESLEVTVLCHDPSHGGPATGQGSTWSTFKERRVEVPAPQGDMLCT